MKIYMIAVLLLSVIGCADLMTKTSNIQADVCKGLPLVVKILQQPTPLELKNLGFNDQAMQDYYTAMGWVIMLSNVTCKQT